MRDIGPDDLPGVFGSSVLNLIRRGADGSLRMSADRWRFGGGDSERVVFRSIHDDPAESEQMLEVPLAEVARLTWDRLPRQQARSQVRFHLTSGDLWTFSGMLNEPAS